MPSHGNCSKLRMDIGPQAIGVHEAAPQSIGHRHQINRATHATATHFQHMGIDHGCRNVSMAEQILHAANVIAGLQQMRGEAMAEGMRRCHLVNAGTRQRTLERARERLTIQMMPAHGSTHRISGMVCLWKHPEPAPRGARAGKLSGKRMRHRNTAAA